MEMREFRQPESDPSAAIAEIYGIMSQLQAEGATDEELPFIESVLSKMNAGQLSPSEALKEVRKKVSSRNSYH